jgi:hypothetical protein
MILELLEAYCIGFVRGSAVTFAVGTPIVAIFLIVERIRNK